MADTTTATDSPVRVWKKRISAGLDKKKDWITRQRVKECYRYYEGEQLDKPTDDDGVRFVQINKIHPEIRNNIPSLYYYRPYARLTPAPEQIDDPGTEIEKDIQLLQDTANHLLRDPEGRFRESTFLGLKEAHWAFGTVEVGYSPEFVDAPNAPKPPLKEQKDTKIPKPPKPDMPAEPTPEAMSSVESELASLKAQLRRERFFVKHIPYDQVLCSPSDKPILLDNDWVGYWEDVPLQDVKASEAYKGTEKLKACTDEEDSEKDKKYVEETGSLESIRLYKIWDLRTHVRYVLAAGHDKFLLEKHYNRCPLKFLRFDVGPYHFYPRPLILSKLDVQDEYNRSRQFIADVRDGVRARYTYDEDAFEAKQIKKLERGEMGTYIPRKGGTPADVISPVQQPSYSENALQALTLSDKEFQDVGGVGSDSKVAQTKTATQANIAEMKNQVQDSFDRQLVAEWLSDIVKELLSLAIENMNIDRWVQINTVPEGMFAPQIAQDIQTRFKRINADLLSDTASGVNWDVQIDLESLSPVSEEQKFQKLMQGEMLFANPVLARLYSVCPPLLELTLDAMGIKSGKVKETILGAMQQVVQMEQILAAQGQNAAPGVPSQPAAKPAPAAGPQQKPGPPQPSGPAVPKGA
jgi:hypothetical protein